LTSTKDYNCIIFSFTDIDECLFANGGCEDQCLNFNGSFQCQCRADSFLENGGVSCRGKVKSKIEDDRFWGGGEVLLETVIEFIEQHRRSFSILP
jgi:hypothetical protein